MNEEHQRALEFVRSANAYYGITELKYGPKQAFELCKAVAAIGAQSMESTPSATAMFMAGALDIHGVHVTWSAN